MLLVSGRADAQGLTHTKGATIKAQVGSLLGSMQYAVCYYYIILLHEGGDICCWLAVGLTPKD